MSSEDQFQRVVLRRLTALERSRSRLRWIIALLLVVIAWRGLAAGFAASTVRTRALELVDPDGRVTATLGNSAAGPALILRDTAGLWKAVLRVDAEGGALRLVGSSEEIALDLVPGTEPASPAAPQ